MGKGREMKNKILKGKKIRGSFSFFSTGEFSLEFYSFQTSYLGLFSNLFLF